MHAVVKNAICLLQLIPKMKTDRNSSDPQFTVLILHQFNDLFVSPNINTFSAEHRNQRSKAFQERNKNVHQFWVPLPRYYCMLVTLFCGRVSKLGRTVVPLMESQLSQMPFYTKKSITSLHMKIVFEQKRTRSIRQNKNVQKKLV